MEAVTDVVSIVQGKTIIGYYVFGHIHLDNAIVELIAYQSIAIPEPDGARRQRRRDAERVSIGEIFPDNLVFGVDFDRAGIAGIGQQSVAIGKTAGERHRAHGAAGGEGPDDLVGARHFDRAVVVLVRDEDVTIFEKFGGVWTAKLVSSIGIGEAGILPDNMFFQVHFNDSIVALVGDEHVRIGKPGALDRSVQEVRAAACLAKLSVLPDKPIMDLGEKSFGPSPNCQTIVPSGRASMTRLLN
jgi:hypothetical protein